VGSPDGNWFRWLEKQLIKRRLDVWLPTLPNADKPSLKEWLKFVEDNCPFDIDKDTVVIGHSSGAILGIMMLQSGYNLGALIAVSIFIDNSLGWEPNDRLFDVDFDYDKLRANRSKRLIINSDTDPYVPVEKAEEIAGKSRTELLVIKDQGHFNLEQGEDYKEFPKLLKILEDRNLL
jgi:predicted alpha/beta hydrolase family esterase